MERRRASARHACLSRGRELILSSDHDFLDVGKIYARVSISFCFSHHLFNGFCDPVARAHGTFRLLLEQEAKKTTFADRFGNSVEVVCCVNGLKRLLEFRRQEGWGINNIRDSTSLETRNKFQRR